ncbi:MAG: hypothetical protein EOP50_13070 [Sphingobacteriales bacterium]|nr:MAG: hypothetical protein EOP50_13070 [Sphingobacteriales bacterium]
MNFYQSKCYAHAKSGCLPFGSLLIIERRQSAATAWWAARPSAVSARISDANAGQRQAELPQTSTKGWLHAWSKRQGKVLPLCFVHQPNCAFQRTLTRSFASATPCGRR